MEGCETGVSWACTGCACNQKKEKKNTNKKMSSPNAVVQARLCTWPVCVAARSRQKFSNSELWLEHQPPPAVDTVVSAEKTHYRYNVCFSKKIKGGSTAEAGGSLTTCAT